MLYREKTVAVEVVVGEEEEVSSPRHNGYPIHILIPICNLLHLDFLLIYNQDIDNMPKLENK